MPTSSQPTPWAAIPIPETSDWAVASGEQPVLNLIQWVCAQHSERSRTWLRQKILLPAQGQSRLTPQEQMAIRVFAKRTHESPDLKPPAATITIPPTPHLPDPDLMYTLPARLDSDSAVATYLRQRLADLPTERGTRSVLALALDSQRRPLGIARARNALRRDAHAEWILIQTLSEAAREQISEIWITLKPCRFCAALLYPFAKRGNVTYLEHDPGSWGRATCLDHESPDRRRFYPEDRVQRERLWSVPGTSSITSTNS